MNCKPRNNIKKMASLDSLTFQSGRPSIQEYERTVVTAFDAYIKPTVDTYLSNLTEALQNEGVNAPLQVMQSRGGLAGCKTARARPVRLFLSGPAGGVIGSLEEGRTNGFQNLITVDIGGTSCDIALINSETPSSPGRCD